MQKRVKQLEKQCARCEQKYNTLLEKNQNDLIKIRLRQKQLNETIGKLEKQKQHIQNEYKLKVKLLQEQVSKLKDNLKKCFQEPGSKIQDKKQNQKLDLNTQNTRLQEENKGLITEMTLLSDQLQKAVEQNTKLKLQQSQSSQKAQKSLKKMLEEAQSQNQELIKAVKEMQGVINQLNKDNSELKLRMEKQIQGFVQRQKQSKYCYESKENQLKKHSDVLYSQVDRLRQLLQLIDIQYKNLLQKQKLKEELLQSKNDQLNLMTQELIDMQQKVERTKQLQVFKSKHAEQENRNQELEQQNMLLKEMIKSHKTMIKIKDNQIERLKSK